MSALLTEGFFSRPSARAYPSFFLDIEVCLALGSHVGLPLRDSRLGLSGKKQAPCTPASESPCDRHETKTKTATTSLLGHTTAGADCVAQTFRLMLLGLPPDMVHGALSHRTHRRMTQ